MDGPPPVLTYVSSSVPPPLPVTENIPIGLDDAPPSFDVYYKVQGPGGANLQYIRDQTGANLSLHIGTGVHPQLICVQHENVEMLQVACQLVYDLVLSIQKEFAELTRQPIQCLETNLTGPTEFPSNTCSTEVNVPEGSAPAWDVSDRIVNRTQVKGDLIQQQSAIQQINNQSSSVAGYQQFLSESIKPDSSGSEIQTMSTSPFPNLVLLINHFTDHIFKPNFKLLDGVDLINSCLHQYHYRPLQLEWMSPVNNLLLKERVQISYDGNVLVEVEGMGRKKTKRAAGERLIEMLRKTNYSIELNTSYFNGTVNKKRRGRWIFKHTTRIADHILNVDPSLSHIYKVIILETPILKSKLPFKIKPIEAVKYVSSTEELWMCIDNHVKSDSEADLYVFNIPTDEHTMRTIITCKYGGAGFVGRVPIGCYGKGIVISRRENIPKLFEDLKKCGGQNIKYRLISPGGRRFYGDYTTQLAMELNTKVEHKPAPLSVGNCGNNIKLQVDSLSPDNNAKVHDIEEIQGGAMTVETAKQIEIPRWIANNLILMVFFGSNGSFVTPYNYIRLSVHNCLITETFETKTFEEDASLILCEALIGRALVGIGRASSRSEAETQAVKNAIKNLENYCFAIKVKHSYFPGIDQIPSFLTEENPPGLNKIFSVVDPNETTIVSESELWKIFQQFKDSELEDLFFLNDFSYKDILFVCSVAKDVELHSRPFGQGCACIYKKRCPQELYEELQRNGGENEKYGLVAPSRSKLQGSSQSPDKNTNVSDNEDCGEMANETTKQLEIPQWIAGHLILMDYFELNSSYVTSLDYLKHSVLNCPEFEDFIIEIQFDKNTSLHTCEALIDGALVGIGRAYHEKVAETLAVQNALQSLEACCSSIKVKRSYLGTSKEMPTFLVEENPPGNNEIFRIVDPKEAISEPEFCKLLEEFKNSKLQDLFFLKNVPYQDVLLVLSIAKDMELQSRQFGNGCACVSKIRLPKDIYEELNRTGGENVKYKLFNPSRNFRSNKSKPIEQVNTKKQQVNTKKQQVNTKKQRVNTKKQRVKTKKQHQVNKIQINVSKSLWDFVKPKDDLD